MTGSFHHTAVSKVACLRIYFVYKDTEVYSLLGTCNTINSPDRDSSRMNRKSITLCAD